MATLAGQYGPEGIMYPNGSAAANVFITVENLDGSLAEIWLEPSKTVPATNPQRTDALGNLTFYAEPGRYRLLRDGVLVLIVMVSRHPQEPISDEDKDQVAADVLEDVLEEILPPVSYVTVYESARQ